MKSDQDLIDKLSRLPKESLSARDKIEIHKFVQEAMNRVNTVPNGAKSFPGRTASVIGTMAAGVVIIALGALAINDQKLHQKLREDTAKHPKPGLNVDSQATQSSPDLTGVQVFPNGGGWLNDTTSGTLLRTADNGLHWSSVRQMAGQQSTDIVTTLNSNVAWLAEGEQRKQSASITIYKTVNGGTHWKLLTAIQRLRGSSAGQLPAYLSFIDEKHGWMVTQIPNYGMGSTSPGALYRTKDGGVTWSLDSTHVKKGFVSFRWVNFTTSAIGFTVGSGQSQLTDGGTTQESTDQLFITQDGGNTWRAISLQLPKGSSILRPTFSTKQSGVLPVIVTQNGVSSLFMFRTLDGGMTWVKTGIKTVTGTPTVTMYTANDGYMLDGSTLFHTVDFGGHWTLVGPVPVTMRNYYVSMHFKNVKVGWCYAWPNPFIEPNAKTGLLYRTSDAGHVWTKIPIS